MKITTLPRIKQVLAGEKKRLADNYGVSNIGVFGSYVFGDDTKKSDVDILVDFTKPVGLLKFIELQQYLSDKLGKKVDLVAKDGLKQYVKKNILHSAVYV